MSHTTQSYDKTKLGFWLYLMSDIVLFGCLFATFQVLRHNTAGGPDARELFDLPFVLVETILLLASSLTSGIGLLYLRIGRVNVFRTLLAITVVLGASFLAMELYEFHHLVAEGASWQRSAFLSGFFTLVGTHGFHILIGLIWAMTLFVMTFKKKLQRDTFAARASMFTTFWHFLDFVWIFIFTVVYLMGVA